MDRLLAMAALAPARFPGAALGAADELDPGFGAAVLESSALPADVLVQSDGKLLVPDSRSFNVLRVNPDGTPDRGYAPETDYPDGARIGAAALQPDGKLLLAGTIGDDRFVAARRDAHGALDQSFSASPIAFDDRAKAFAAALQPDGRFVIAGLKALLGGVAERTALARVLADPPPPSAGPAPSGRAPRCGGRTATIVGTAGRDILRGTRRVDVIAALGGNDRVAALGGNDIVCGGPGSDRIAGGRGRDVLMGGPGRDRLLGGLQRDRCLGGRAHRC